MVGTAPRDSVTGTQRSFKAHLTTSHSTLIDAPDIQSDDFRSPYGSSNSMIRYFLKRFSNACRASAGRWWLLEVSFSIITRVE